MATEGIFVETDLPAPDIWRALWPDPAAVLRAVGVGRGQFAVDLCCGDGLFTRPMCGLVGAGQVLAVDLDPVLLERTRAACADCGNLRTACGDARQLSEFVQTSADHVFLANTLHGVPDPEALARAVHEVLSPGGRFSVVNWHPRPREETLVLGTPRGPETALRMAPARVERALAPAGFVLHHVVDVGPYHYGAVFVREELR